MTRRNLLVALSIIILIMSSAIPFSNFVLPQVYAHRLSNQETPGRIETVYFKEVKINYNKILAYNPNIAVFFGVYQPNHDKYAVDNLIDLNDYDTKNLQNRGTLADITLDPNKFPDLKNYAHEECSPATPMVIYVSGLQYKGDEFSDSTAKDAAKSVGAAVGAEILKHITDFTPVGPIIEGIDLIHLIGKYGWAKSSNYGSGGMVFDPNSDKPGEKTITTTGGDGLATVTLVVDVTSRTYETYDKSCYDIATALYTVPNWVKNTAGWWANGQVSDKEFAMSLGYLTKEGLVSTNSTANESSSVSVSDNIQIPSWIKNNAKWWASGQISDDEFLKGVQYMMDSNIISFTPKSSNSTIGSTLG